MITWLSSYPRSGNTFLRTLLHQGLGVETCSLYNDTDIGGNPELAAVTGHRQLAHRIYDQDFDLATLRADPNMTFIKTHEIGPELVTPGDRVIYIVRDGREATVSHVRYERNIMGRSISAMELIMGVHFPGGAWADHVRRWKPAGRDDTLLVRFEHLVQDPGAELDRLAAFTGLPLLEARLPDFAELQRIDARFFTSGRSDTWRSELSDAEHDLFWLRSHPEMDALGYRELAPAWLGRLDPEQRHAFSGALRQAASDLASRVASSRAAQEDTVAELRAHIEYRERLIRDLRGELEHRSRDLDLFRVQTFQLQDELNFYYRAFIQRDGDLETYLAADPALRLARATRHTP